MQRIDNLNDDADQLITFVLSDGSTMDLEFFYRPAVQRWTLSITHPLVTLNNINLVLSPNILRPWKNVIPFGIALTSLTGLDPFRSTDLQDGTVSIYVLSAAEVLQVESEILAPTALVNP